MFWIMIIAVVAITTGAEVYKTHAKQQTKTLELREKLIKEEYKLEIAKQETFRLENERLRLQLNSDMVQFEREKQVRLEK
ncbi:hypothetical protein [Caryophanon latum]|uniref:Uncharacterized protein n=1 Tax=Caryophanon latum TaxID=33977 RepID=A0A1C0Z5C9_9BACL|nr:hypothetical protein [Caryophanon latum]OCS94675.1 hypothetical protein A6K76_00455 [Caryophanon latum]